MSRGTTTLGDLHTVAEASSRSCHDDIVPVSDLNFTSIDKVMIAGQEYGVRPSAQTALCTRIGAPYSFIRRCSSDLQQQIIHEMMPKDESRLFVRYQGSSVRAIFSTRYTPVDNIEIINRMFEMGYNPDTEIQYAFDEQIMNLSIPDNHKTFEVSKGDAIKPGISISNSEVGLCAVHVSAYMLRLVCTNGLIKKSIEGSRFYHVSRKALDYLPQTIDNLAHDVEESSKLLAVSLTSSVTDPEATFDKFNRQFMLSEPERSAVAWAWPQEEGGTMFNIINTYTKAAQYAELSDVSSNKLSSVGGAILSLVQ